MTSKVALFELEPTTGERLWLDDGSSLTAGLASLGNADLAAKAEHFAMHGWLHLEGAVDTDLVDAAVFAYEEWCSKADQSKLEIRGDGRRPRVVNLHCARAEFRDLLTKSSGLFEVTDMLFGYETSVYTSLTFEYGTEQPFHRDTPVFCTEPEEFYFGLWIALEDADESNGALRVLDRGHTGARVDPFTFAQSNLKQWSDLEPSGSALWASYQDEVVARAVAEGATPKSLPAKKGDVVIWHPQLPHGGGEIGDPTRTRKSVVYHVTPVGGPVYQADRFFDPNADRPRVAEFKYEQYDGRYFVRREARIGKN